MKNINGVALKIFSLLSIAYGISIIAKNFDFSFFTLNNSPDIASEKGVLLFFCNIFFALILPSLYIAGGVGIFYSRKWGQKIILLCLVTTIIFDLYGLAIAISNSPVKHQGIEAGTVVIAKSLMLEHMISILAVVCFIFLLRQRKWIPGKISDESSGRVPRGLPGTCNVPRK